MSKAFVEIRMQIVATVAIFGDEATRGFVNDKFLIHATTMGRMGIGRCEVGYCNRFRTKITANPVGVGQIDTDSRGRV